MRLRGLALLSIATLGAGAAVALTVPAANRHTQTAVPIKQVKVASVEVQDGQTLGPGESITSSDGDYQLVMQFDGDLQELSLYGISPIYSAPFDGYLGGGNSDGGILVGRDINVLWSSGTAGNPGAAAVMQGDGNLVIRSVSGSVLWASGTAGHPGAHLIAQPDANVVIYSPGGRALWATNTVSVVDSHGQGPVNFRSCPGGAASPDACRVISGLSDAVGVTMKCWTSPQQPGWFSEPTGKWFYVQVDNGASAGLLGFINAAFVDNQIRTPQCIGEIAPGQPIPSAPSLDPGTAPAAPTPATTPPVGPPPTSAAPAASAPAPPTQPSPQPPAQTSAPPAAQTWNEQSGTHGSPTFTDPYNASGQGPTIPAMATVTVLCRVYAPQIASANPDGWWYRIGTAPWGGSYYAVANTFWNGDIPGQKPYTHNTDWSVAVC